MTNEREALVELVALKDLKAEIQRLEALPIGETYRNGLPGMIEPKRADYARRKPLAWEAARAVLSQPNPSETQNSSHPICRDDTEHGKDYYTAEHMAAEFERGRRSAEVGTIKRIDTPPGRPDLHEWTGHEWIPAGYSMARVGSAVGAALLDAEQRK